MIEAQCQRPETALGKALGRPDCRPFECITLEACSDRQQQKHQMHLFTPTSVRSPELCVCVCVGGEG